MNNSFDGSERKDTGLVLLFRVTIKKLLSLIVLNLVFCLAALPLVTLPNALAALYRCAALILREEDFTLGKTFFAVFKSEFFKTMAAGWIVLLLFLGAIAGALFYWSISVPLGLLLAIACTVMAVYFYLAACNLFFMLSRVRLPFGALLKNAFILVFLQPIGRTAVCLLSFLILAASAWWFPRTLPVIMLISESFAALITCYAVRDKIEKSIVL